MEGDTKKNLIMWIFALTALVLVISYVTTPWENRKQISYQRFKELLRTGKVEKLVMEGEEVRGTVNSDQVIIKDVEVDGKTIDGEEIRQYSFAKLRDLMEKTDIQVEYKAPPEEDSQKYLPVISTGQSDKKATVKKFTLKLPSTPDDELQRQIDLAHQIYSVEGRDIPEQFNKGRDQTNFLYLLLWGAVPIVLFFIFWFYLSSRMGGQGGGGIMNIGKMKGDVFDEEDSVDTTFDDVAGLESAKEDLKEIISFLKSPERYHRMGGKIPKGTLLVGAPGTGKTLMARAVAGEAGVPFFSLTGSSFMEMFVGVGASRVRDLFDTAKSRTPCIIFIDELESVGRKRGAGVGGGHDEREQTLNQLLSEMDGFEPRDNVVVLAATNRPDILDPAILRPGRFDREIRVNMPTVKERREILEVHAREVPLAEDVDLDHLAKETPGHSGADLENLVNEAAICAAREEDSKVRMEHFLFAVDRTTLGREREGMVLSKDERELIAYHEVGHAIVAQYSEHADPLFKITIIPRGKSLGCTKQLPEEERYNYSKEYMLSRLQVILGGRASEKIFFDTFTTGGADDLNKAKDICKKMVCNWGMSERLGHVSMSNGDQEVFLGQDLAQGKDYSEKTAQIIDEEIGEFTQNAFNNAVEIIKEHREQVEDLVEQLLEKETLEREEILKILGEEDELEQRKEEQESSEEGESTDEEEEPAEAEASETESESESDEDEVSESEEQIET